MMVPPTRFEINGRSGSAARVFVVVLCVAALAWIGWLMSLPPDLKAKYAGDLPGASGGFAGLWLAIAGLVLSVLALCMPIFVWQCAQEARRCRELLEQMHALQAQQAQAVATYATPPQEWEQPQAVEEEVPIYPPTGPSKVRFTR